MPTIALSWINHLKAATLAASSEVGSLSAANLLVDHLATKWRSAPGTAAFITADLTAAKPCRLFGIFGSNVTPAATWRVRLSSSAAHAGDLYDSGVVAMGAVVVNTVLKRNIAQAALLLPAAINARYVKIDLSDASIALNYVEAGAAWAGDAWQPAYGRSWGAVDGFKDEGPASYSEGGQKYIIRRDRQRVQQFSLDNLTDAERYNQVSALDRLAGRVENILVVPEPGGAYQNHDTVFGTLSALGAVTRRQVNLRARRFEIEERL
ncbi:MAG: hypothetical protein IPK59_04115 [Rhodospirillaceae bacterium]|nr:hypothetical protein [Rhodospirillaceae bacterium]